MTNGEAAASMAANTPAGMTSSMPAPRTRVAQFRFDLRRATGFAAVMRLTIRFSLVALAVALCGCASDQKPKFADVPGPSDGMTGGQPVVKPSDALTGKVVTYNAVGRFTVLNFPLTRMPAMEQTLFLYRDGMKVGEVKITGPQKDDNIVADLVQGEAKAGDEVRDR